ncbi:MAG: 4-alpha-glucanotransferase [Gammaproteobacteria bacterium]
MANNSALPDSTLPYVDLLKGRVDQVRAAGVCLHITALPGDHGIGSLGEQALKFVDSLSAMGMSVWQFLPLGPTAYADSPYQPLSIYAGNPMLIDLELLHQDGLVTTEQLEPFTHLARSRVDFSRLIPLKKRLLDDVSIDFASRASASLRLEWEAFLAKHETQWLNDFASFQVLKSQHEGLPWPQWPDRFRRRTPAAMQALQQSAAKELHSVKLSQFLFYRQWLKIREYANSKGIAMFGDIPIYLALDSADVWQQPELVQIDCDGKPDQVAGVPPDYFSEHGQLWGNPVYDWSYHQAQNYQWWIERIRQQLTQVDIVRLDHFRAFESYWSIPEGAETAKEGDWMKGPGDELFTSLKGALGQLPLVAEDLGLITDDVRALLSRLGFPGMQVLQFMVDQPGFDCNQILANSVCYSGTHDNDTTRGWYDERRQEEGGGDFERMVLGNIGGSADNVVDTLIRLAYDSEAQLVITPMQDVLGLGSEARYNTPGTTQGNWQWRMTADELTEPAIERMREHAIRTGRASSQVL